MNLSGIYLPILATVGTTLAGVLATWITAVGTKWLKNHTGIELDQNQQAQAKQIIQGVEEKELAMVKANAAAPKKAVPVVVPTGPEKHADAVTQLQTLNPDMTTTEAVSQVDRAVGSSPDIGAFKPTCATPGLPFGA